VKRKTELAQETDAMLLRLKRLPSPDLIPWAENCLYGAGRCLDRYAETGEPDLLLEAHQAADVLKAALDEISERAAAGRL
jgi:hypothetical protein